MVENRTASGTALHYLAHAIHTQVAQSPGQTKTMN